MKKTLSLLLVLVMIFSLGTTISAEGENEVSLNNESIKILVNGEYVYPDSDPVIINDRTLCPIRAVAERLGFEVDWEPEKREAVVLGNGMLRIPIDENYMTKYKAVGAGGFSNYLVEYKKDKTINLDVPAQIINDRTYLPLRAVGEALDCEVDWDGATRTVIINFR